MRVRNDGPDISYWQWSPRSPTDPSFDQLPYFPFFAHRCTRGHDVKDDGFDRGWEQMRLQGYQFRGAYHWLEPVRWIGSVGVHPVMQAEQHLAVLKAHGGLQPGEFVYVDIERSVGTAERDFHGAEWPTVAQCADYVEFIQRKIGNRIGVYVGWYSADPSGFLYRRWVAEQGYVWILPWYTAPDGSDAKFDAAKPSGFHVRQHTSKAVVPGMPTNVDMNHVLDWAKLAEVAGY